MHFVSTISRSCAPKFGDSAVQTVDAVDPAPHLSAEQLPRWAMALVVLVAACIRLIMIDQPLVDAFSWRQASTAMMADNFYRVDRNILFPQVSWTGPGPSYQGREFQTVSYLAALLYGVLGQHDWIGRGIAVVCGAWTVFALYQLTRRVWDTTHALATALVYALLPGAIFIDRCFLPDPAMLSLIATALWMFVAYAQTDRARYLAAGAVALALAWLTKLPSVVTVGALGYAMLTILRQRKVLDRARIRALALTVGLVLLPVIAYYAWAVHLGRAYPPYHVAGASNWIWKDGIFWWFERAWFLSEAFNHLNRWLWTAPIIVLAVLGLLAGPPVREDDRRPTAPWFFHCWGAGFVIFYALGARELTENPWNFHILAPVAAAFAARVLIIVMSWSGAHTNIGIRWDKMALPAVVILGILATYALPALRSMYREQSADTYRMGLALRDLATPDELVLTIADDVGDPIGIYYSRRHGWVFPPAGMPHFWKPWNYFPPDDGVSIEMFEALRARGARWLGIVVRPREDRGGQNFWIDHKELISHVNRTCELVSKTPNYVIYRVPPPMPTP